MSFLLIFFMTANKIHLHEILFIYNFNISCFVMSREESYVKDGFEYPSG